MDVRGHYRNGRWVRPHTRRGGAASAGAGAAVIAVAVVAVVTGGSPQEILERLPLSGASSSTGPSVTATGTVTTVLDGDTLTIRTPAGSTQRVRLLGIDAPEVPHQDAAGECGGKTARSHLRGLAPVGTTITLTSDLTQASTDRYGRQLRYGRVAGRDLSRDQLRTGHARHATYGTQPLTRAEDYEAVARAARTTKAGLWRHCPDLAR